MKALRRISTSLTAVTIAVVFVFTAAGIIEAFAAENVPELRENNFLGVAANFGVFTNGTWTVRTDSETTFAVKKLKVEDGGISNFGKLSGYPRISYLSELESKRDTFTLGSNGYGNEYLVVGGNTSATKKQNGTWEIQSGPKKINIDNRMKNVVQNRSYIDLDAEMRKLSDIAKTLYKLPNTASFNGKDNNDCAITCNANENGVSVLNISLRSLHTNGNRVKLKNIKNINLLIINVNTDGNNNVTIGKEVCDGNGIELGDWNAISSKIVWNFGSYNGKINTSTRNSGVLLAPNADIAISSSNWNGIVIGKNVENRGNEIHYIPFTYEAPEEDTNKIIIESVDADASPVTGIPGGEYALWKKNAKGNYKKVKNSEAKVVRSDDGTTYIAKWEITEPGEYYIRQTEKPATNTEGGYSYMDSTLIGLFKAELKGDKIVVTVTPGNASDGCLTETVKVDKINGYRMDNHRKEAMEGRVTVGDCAYGIFRIDMSDIGCFNKSSKRAEKIISTRNEVSAWRRIQDAGYYAVVNLTAPEDIPKDELIHYVAAYLSPEGKTIPFEVSDSDFADKVEEAMDGEARELKKITDKADSFIADNAY